MDGATSIPEAALPGKRRPQGALLFLPAALSRGAFIQWLKRIHAWTGFWGALMFLVIGSSGVLLNHRAQLKIETGEPREVMSVVIPVDAARIKSPGDLAAWAQKQFNTSIEPRAAKGGDGGGEGAKGARGGDKARFMGREFQPAPVWKQTLSGPNGVISVEYTPGANTVKAARAEQNFAGLIKNLHKGSGLSWPWVLFIDSMAGALVAMALSGALLWSRLHGPRLAALGLVLASIGVGLFAAWPAIL
jgi:hypothetical protein